VKKHHRQNSLDMLDDMTEDQQLYEQQRNKFERQEQGRQNEVEKQIWEAKVAKVEAKQRLKDQRQKREEDLTRAEEAKQQEIKRRRKVLHEGVIKAMGL